MKLPESAKILFICKWKEIQMNIVGWQFVNNRRQFKANFEIEDNMKIEHGRVYWYHIKTIAIFKFQCLRYPVYYY